MKPMELIEQGRFLGEEFLLWLWRRGLEEGGTSGVDLLFIDSSHEREPTLAEVAAWRPALAAGALIAFDDYGHPDYPGVAEAVADLGADGEERASLFLWRLP